MEMFKYSLLLFGKHVQAKLSSFHGCQGSSRHYVKNINCLKRLDDYLADIIIRGLTLRKTRDAELIQHDSLSGGVRTETQACGYQGPARSSTSL